MSSNKCLMIINPRSGTASKRGLEWWATRRLAKSGIDLETIVTQAPGDAHRLARHAADAGYLGVIAAGGDGTVNEIASAIRGTKTALGIVPCGSGNGLARHLELTSDLNEALDVIGSRHIEACDCGEANGISFFCTFGLGFDAAVSEKFASSRRRGPLNYLKSVILEYTKFKPEEFEIETDNGYSFKFKAFIVAVCNASQYGNNAFIAPSASIRDGLLDITIVHSGTPLSRALVGVDLFTGLIERNILIQTLRVKSAKIRTTSNKAHADGEPITINNEIKVDCIPGDLLIFTNEKKTPFRPMITPLKYFHRDFWARLRKLFEKHS